MKKIKLYFSLLLLVLFFLPVISAAQNISDYLILQDIGLFKLSRPEKLIPGFAPMGGPRTYDRAGVLASADHSPDHTDKTYEVMYLGGDANPSPTVQVTQHAGADSDKWLLHEVEHGYRRSKELKATYSAPNPIRIINNNKLWFRWGAYRWISNNIVVSIEFTDITGTKPEPLEVVQAYLQKFPSTITLTDTEMKTRAHNETWIKEEMERRLWLCDKWNMQFQSGKVTQADMLQQLVDHMTVFLNYRHKYYGVKAIDDIIALNDYLKDNDATSIMNKLTAYKAWWSANKGNAISL